MKSFKEYLTESKKVYEFKIKIAGDMGKDVAKKIKEALDCYKVESCSAGKRLPIAETHSDFPEVKNTSVTIFDVCLAYPTTSQVVRAALAERLKISADLLRVRNLKEEEEIAINHQHDKKSGESLLAKDDLEAVDGQKLVGDQHTMSLLKELNKIKHAGEQVTGTNDALLAKSSPKGK
jgi:hypothetical protein